jgi:hypothetical protein
VYDLERDHQYIVDLNVSICFEAAQLCETVSTLFHKTFLPKMPCMWQTGFIQKGIYIYNIRVLMVNIEFMWRGLATGERMSFSESSHPFCAEPHKFYIYRQYTNIVFILQ